MKKFFKNLSFVIPRSIQALDFFLLRPRFLSTIFFIPILYCIGWALSQPLLLFNFEKENLSLIGTIITFLLFIFLLPYWFYIRWNISSVWVLLGISKDKFSFTINEFERLKDLFKKTKQEYYQNLHHSQH